MFLDRRRARRYSVDVVTERLPGGGEPSAARGAELGRRLRAARQDQGITVRALAARLKCSPSHISQIERGLVAPSTSLLYSIVSELRLSFDAVFSGPAETARPEDAAKAAGRLADSALARVPGESRYVQRHGTRKAIEVEPGVRWEMLTPSSDFGLDFREIAYSAGAGSRTSEFIRHAGREYGVVLTGRLHVQVEFDEFVLGPGDSITFDSSRPHRFWNEGQETARAVWVSGYGS